MKELNFERERNRINGTRTPIELVEDSLDDIEQASSIILILELEDHDIIYTHSSMRRSEAYGLLEYAKDCLRDDFNRGPFVKEE